MFLEPLHKGVSQGDVFRIVGVGVLCELAYGYRPFVLQLTPSGYHLHLFFTNFREVETDVLHGLVDELFGLIGHGKGFLLVDDVDVVLHLFEHIGQLGYLQFAESLLQIVIAKGSHNIGTVFGRY